MYRIPQRIYKKATKAKNCIQQSCRLQEQHTKSVLSTSKEESKNKIKKAAPYTAASKRLKHLGINLTKEVKELYAKNYKTLQKEIREGLNKWEDIFVHG